MDPQKDTNMSQTSPKDSTNLIVFELFEKDNYFLFVYKKTERIVSALYLISNLFPDNEPIRLQFRKSGTAIISQVLSLTSTPLSRAEIISRIIPELLHLLSLLSISFTAGLVSHMNFSILKRELESLLETLHFRGSSKPELINKPVAFDKEFFSVPRDHFTPRPATGDVPPQAFFAAKEEKGGQPTPPVYSWSDISRSEENYKRHVVKGQESLNDKSAGPKARVSALGPVGADKRHDVQSSGNDRQTEIIKLLKNKNNLTIRDFSLVIKGCSEKTVQRELFKLVRRGVLNKVGERRWSRYSLAVL